MGQRVMKIQGLKQLQQASPSLYDPIAIDTAALHAMGWSNPEQFFVPPAARAAPPPQLQQMQEQMKNDAKAADAKVEEANARTAEAKAKAADVQAKIDSGHYGPKPTEGGLKPPEPETQLDLATAQAKVMDAHTRAGELALKERTAAVENDNRDRDREAKERESAISLASDVIRAPVNERGSQVGVKGAGQKANKIIDEVDKKIDES
jgi:hypothetical protein